MKEKSSAFIDEVIVVVHKFKNKTSRIVYIFLNVNMDILVDIN